MAAEAVDGTPVARASDFRRIAREVASLGHAQRALAARVSALEAAASDLRADVVAGYHVDRELNELVEAMLADLGACRR